MNPIFYLFYFIYKKIKEFFILLWAIVTGNAEMIVDPKEFFKFDFKAILKENWRFFILVIGAFFVGWFCAGMYYQSILNTTIQEIVDNMTLNRLEVDLDFINMTPIN